jgi:hypothetical protein
MSFESFPQKRAHVLYSTLPHFLHVTVRASCRSFIHICHSPPRSGLRGPRWSLVESWQGKQGTAHQPLRLGSSPRRWPRAFESQTCQSSWRRVDTVRGWRRGRPPPPALPLAAGCCWDALAHPHPTHTKVKVSSNPYQSLKVHKRENFWAPILNFVLFYS